MSGKKYVVTGAAGFIASNLVKELIRRESHVTGIDNFLTGKKENIEPFKDKINFIEGDVRDYSLMESAAKDADCIFHLAALASVPWSVEEPLLSHSHNVGGTLNVLNAARVQNVPRVVFSSSAAIYGDDPELPVLESATPKPASPYALDKLTGEHYLKLFNKIYKTGGIALRYFNVFGPGQDPKGMYAAAIPGLLSKILNDENPVIYGDGKQTRDFIHVNEVVRANILASEAPNEALGKVFNIGCGKSVDINSLVNQMTKILGVSISPRYEAKRAGDVLHSCADILLAKKILGFESETEVFEGLKKSIDWYKKVL